MLVDLVLQVHHLEQPLLRPVLMQVRLEKGAGALKVASACSVHRLQHQRVTTIFGTNRRLGFVTPLAVPQA